MRFARPIRVALNPTAGGGDEAPRTGSARPPAGRFAMIDK